MIKTNLRKDAFMYLNANTERRINPYLVFHIQSFDYTEKNPMLTAT